MITGQLRRSSDACWGYVAAGDETQLALWSQHVRRLHLLNETAAAVWESLAKPAVAVEVASRLSREYGVALATVSADIAPVLEQLIEGELITDCPSKPIDVDLVVDEPIDLRLSFDDGVSIGPIRSLGVPLLVDIHDPDLHASLRPILEPLQTRPAVLDTSGVVHLAVYRRPNGWVVERNGMPRSRAQSAEQALRNLLGEVNAAPLDVLDDSVVLHAAGVEFGSSSASSLVVFPGVSNSGKSTITAQLCMRGHGYLTDEAVSIDTASLRARPFHKSLCIEASAQELLGELASAAPQPQLSSKWDIDPRRLGPGRLSSGGNVGALVFPTYTDGATVALERLQPLEVLQRLIANAFDFSRVGQPAFSALVNLANTTPAFSLTHGGGGAQLDLLETRFGAARTGTVSADGSRQSRIARRSAGGPAVSCSA